MPPITESAECLSQADGIRTAIYENTVPPFAETALEQLYQNLYASMIWLRVTGSTERLHTYVVTEDARPRTILLFRIDGRQVVVINHVIRIDATEMARFADTLFARFKKVDVISFRTIQTDLSQLVYPYQRFNTSENIVLSLPATADDYVAALGKNTRKNVRYYLNRVKRTFPSFEYRLQQQGAVSESDVMEILRLKTGRTSASGGAPPTPPDTADIRRTLDLVEARGLVGVITIDGKVCAGSIGYRIGAHAFGSVLAHDPEYDGHWIGMLCCFLTICESIALGCREYHFLWGQDDYKFRMLGVLRELDDVNIYRSRLRGALHPYVAGALCATGYNRRLRLRLREASASESRFGKMLNSVTRLHRKLRQAS